MKNLFLYTTFLFFAAFFQIAQAATYTSRIAVVVNGDGITEKQIKDRVKLVAFTSGGKMDVTSKILREQVIESLIEEKLQVQRAKALKLKLEDTEVTEQLVNIAKENGKTVSEMQAFFKDNGVNFESLKSRIYAQITWIKLVREGYAHFVNVSDQAVDRHLQKMKNALNSARYSYHEIVVGFSDLKSEREAQKRAFEIRKQLDSGAKFSSIARQFSSAQSAKNGGSVENNPSMQMDDDLLRTLSTMGTGQISKPIKTPRGFVIVKLDARQSASAKGVLLYDIIAAIAPFSENMPMEDQQALGLKIDSLRSTHSAKLFRKEAKEYGFQIENMSDFNLDQFPEELKALFKDKKPGDVLEPIRDPNGLRIMMIAKKRLKKFETPKKPEVRMMLEQEEYSKISRRELNKLRASAFIEVR